MIGMIWNNPVTRWVAGGVGVLAIFVLTFLAGSRDGKRSEKAKNKLKVLERRVAIEESQNEQITEADGIRADTDVDELPNYHFRDDDGTVVCGED